MRLLMPDNTTFNMDELPDEVSDLKFCILDYVDPNNHVDFHFIPLIFIDQYSRTGVDLQIGPYRITLPLDWSIVIADKNIGALEIVELKNCNDRGFEAFAFNPLRGYIPEFYEINIKNIFAEVSWCVPKLRNGHLLVVPLSDKPNSPCILLVKDINRLSESLDITKIF